MSMDESLEISVRFSMSLSDTLYLYCGVLLGKKMCMFDVMGY